MPEIGQTISHYSIVEKIGKGGMGEVYQAKDLKLGRDVAIKVLPDEFAKDADRVARFQREAKVLASLNHPNIAAIYGLEQSEGTNFLVLELVEGETLADRIKTGPIPVEESLKLAIQIAEALEAAHEKGVIHRDLKPANIKVTPEGKVKVLDFGLAKAYAGEQADLNLSNSPTLSDAATRQGVILGTAAYMSPEQARGKAVDKRADIWAFGCVLFEMLTGRTAFPGKDVTDILAAVIRAEPDWSKLPANLHWRIREVLERCLEKEARDRCSGISDARVEFQKAMADPGGLLVPPVATAKPRSMLRLGLPWVAAIAVFSVLVAGVAVWNFKPAEPRYVTRLYHELPKDQQFSNLYNQALAVSTDGRQFVYTTSSGLFLRSMDQLDARLIPGTEGAEQPVFSPDGKWVAYFSPAEGKLKKIAITGGAPVNLADASVAGGISWGSDDWIVYTEAGKGVLRISANGGTPEIIVKVENSIALAPQILPDGKSVLFTLYKVPAVWITVQSLKTGERKESFQGLAARYLPTGHLVYAVGNNIFACRFDIDKLEVRGGPISMVEGTFQAGGARQYAISDSGTLVYIPGIQSTRSIAKTALVWVNRDGKEEPIAAPPNNYSYPRISPDGTRVALTLGAPPNMGIWVWDLLRKNLTRLTFDPAINAIALWTPDGKRIAYSSNHEGNYKIYWKAADGTGKVEPLFYAPGQTYIASSWSRDGKTLVLMEVAGTAPLQFDIVAVSMDGEKAKKPLLKEKYNEGQPRISPDGQWMAYTSDESGQNQIYVRPFPEVESGRWQISTSGGDSPLWSPDGRELFYRNRDAVMAVRVNTGSGFSYETPKALLSGNYVSADFGLLGLELSPWDISPDGKRFLMMKRLDSESSAAGGPRRINIVLNWFEELKQRVPMK
jgi:serine/threonine protein kinase/Tol biopolymer transport system component